MRTIAIIPARMGSSRFPGKPLARILGRPMIQHVYASAIAYEGFDEVIVATCDREIADAAHSFGAKVSMTSALHIRASDRVAEAVSNDPADVVVMIQGDEPMLQPSMIAAALAPMTIDQTVGCVNLASPINTAADLHDPNTIKVVAGESSDALYFSRSPIPATTFGRFAPGMWFKQVCVIPFRRSLLELFHSLPPSRLESAESIDMLRFLEHGIPVRIVLTEQETRAVDTPDDIAKVERLMTLANG